MVYVLLPISPVQTRDLQWNELKCVAVRRGCCSCLDHHYSNSVPQYSVLCYMIVLWNCLIVYNVKENSGRELFATTAPVKKSENKINQNCTESSNLSQGIFNILGWVVFKNVENKKSRNGDLFRSPLDLITSSLCHDQHPLKTESKSVEIFLNYVAHSQTDKRRKM